MDTNYDYQAQNSSSSDIFDLNGYNQGLGTNVYKTDFKSSSNLQDNSQTIISHSPFSKNDDLKSMLESNKDGLKLEAMKKLITMVAKGRTSSDVSAKDLFPHVVKNIVTKNAELKKLVYLYLLRYAEQEPDLILLSISTFQRSLKDPNPLMRASALRVMSSIRVKIIAPILFVSIKDCSTDMSPYVRDRTSLVLGSAVAAFEEVCPDRFDLIHPNYRKFVSLMADFDEWGQVILINMLIRYGRSQFLNPNMILNSNNNNDDDDELEFNYLDSLDPDHRLLLKNAKPLLQSRNSAVVMSVIQLYLYLAPNSELNSTIVRPLIRLLHSKPEIQIVILTNIVSLTSSKEDEQLESDLDDEKNIDNNLEKENNLDDDFLVETNQNQSSFKKLFEPLLKSFFVKSKDSTQVRILKLKILTNLSSSYNIPLILREFQAYINNYQDDMQFVSATIEAIGKCASRIKEIASICLNGLISLLSNRNEAIIAQSIIVIRKQIINKQKQIERKILINSTINGNLNDNLIDQSEQNSNLNNEVLDKKNSPNKNKKDEKSDHIISLVIKQVSKLIVDKIKTPTAKATVLWILAEFCDKNIKAYQLSPDILRLVAKSFINEVEIVKLQAINLAAKVYLTTCYFETSKNYFTIEDKERIKLLINYIFNLAKYDLNYDVRDRARFLRQLLNKSNTKTGLLLAQKILMAPKNIFIDNIKKEEENEKQKLNQLKNEYTELINEKNQTTDDNTIILPSLLNDINGINKFRIGTLSHFLGKSVNNYEELPDFPTVKPDPSVRNTKIEENDLPTKQQLDKEFNLNSPIKKKINRSTSDDDNFYNDDDDDEIIASTSDESDESDVSSEEDEESNEDEQTDSDNISKNKSNSSSNSSETSDSESSSSEDDNSSSSEESTNENGLNTHIKNQSSNLSEDKLIEC